MPGPADLRVSDAERDRAVERLRTAAGEGRLATEELEDRISGALSARTHGDLEKLLADLPGPKLPAPRQTRAPATPPDPHQRRELLVRQTVAFVIPNAICIAVWAATGAANFWPKWVLLGTSLWFGVFLIRYLARVEHEHYDARGNPRHRGGPPRHRRRRYHR
jgi:Domain of unknown function (DUF1707)